MRAAEKLATLVGAYIESHGAAPKGISMTKEDYLELKDGVNSQLRKELHYSPQFFHGIPIVISPNISETVCRPL
jgi:hypothetical protein